MKRIFKLALIVPMLITAIAIMPVMTAEASGDVEVDASASPTLLLDGETTYIMVEVTNNTASPMIMDHLYADGQTDTYPGVSILPGASEFFYMSHEVSFGPNLDYGFRVEVHYNGGSVAYSDVLDFWIDEGEQAEPAVTTVDFNVSPGDTYVKKDGLVSWEITAKNTGDVDYEDFTVEYVEIGVTDVAVFNLAMGEEKTVTYEAKFGSETLAQFGYRFNYMDEGDSLLKQCEDYIERMVYVIDPDMAVSAQADVAEVEAGSEATITITAKNTGDTDFESVEVNDKEGNEIGNTASIKAGEQAEFMVNVTPEQPSTYQYTVKATDEHGNKYTFDSNEVGIAIMAEPVTLPPVESAGAAETTEPAEPAEMPQATETAVVAVDANGDDELTEESKGGPSTLLIVLIVVVAVLTGTAIPLIIYMNKNKKKGRHAPTDKNVF